MQFSCNEDLFEDTNQEILIIVELFPFWLRDS